MTGWLHRFRLAIIAVSLLLLAGGAAGALKLGFDTDARVYFDRQSDDRAALAAIEARHGRFSSAVFLVVPASGPTSGNVYATEPLAAIADIVSRLDGVPEVAAFSALTELPPYGSAPDDVGALRTYVEAHPRLTGPLVAADGSVSAIVATLQPDGDAPRDTWQVVTDLRAIRDAAMAAHPDIDISMTGSAVLDATFIDALKADLPRLVPVQVALLTILLVVTLGSLTATVALFAVLGVATAVAVGVPGWLGIPLNGVTSAVPTVLMGLAVATSVHIIIAWQHALRDGADRTAAVAYALGVNARPVTLAVMTTIASFLCLNFSTSPPFRQFGNLVALGLAVTYVLSFTLLPALLTMIPAGRALSRRPMESAMAGLGAAVLRWRRVVLAVVAIATVVSTYGITRLAFDDTFTHYFDHRFEFRQATDLYERKLSGITVVEASVPAGDGETYAGHAALARLKAVVDALQAHQEVARATSILDVIALAGESYPGALDSDGLPSSDYVASAMVDGYLSGSTKGAPPGLVDADKRYAHVSIVLDQVSSAELLAFADAADADLDRALGPGVARITGTPVLSAHLSSSNTRTMFIGTLVALAAISVILAVALGGIRMGLVSLVPNLVPLVMAYGFWGLAFGEVSFAATVVVAMTFGIVVDDTVHIMSRYQRLRRRDGLPPEQAVVESLRTVGVAVVITSVAIASGFAVLAFSGFLVNHHLGLLTVITLVAALLTDLLFLPPLLAMTDQAHTQRVNGE